LAQIQEIAHSFKEQSLRVVDFLVRRLLDYGAYLKLLEPWVRKAILIILRHFYKLRKCVILKRFDARICSQMAVLKLTNITVYRLLNSKFSTRKREGLTFS
jgi:hypothetical protein